MTKSSSLAAFTVLIALVSLALPLQAAEKDYSKGSPLAKGQAFSDAKARFEISHPADWKPTPDEQGAQFKADDGRNLKVQVIPVGDAPLAPILEQSREGIKGALKNVKFISDVPARFGERTGNHWVFDCEVDSVPVRLAQLLFLDAGKLYIVSYGSQPTQWSAHAVLCEQMIVTLKPAK